MRRNFAFLTLVSILTTQADAHDIPNARVDRSIQANVRPGRLSVDYEVNLSELTMTQDLRALIGSLPGADRNTWFERYGQVSGPLNAKGLLISVDDHPLELRSLGFDLKVEDHLRYTFHYEADLPLRGRLTIQDTNYESGEGASRLAVRGLAGIVIRGDDLPSDVALIPIVPAWQMSDDEERRTRRVEVRYEVSGEPVSASPARRPTPVRASARPAEGLSKLLDRSDVSIFGLWLIALSLGAAHAVQPGHGKSLVAAASIGEGGGWHRGVVLALAITVAHIGGVMAVALGLWASRSSRYPDINRGLAHAAGFVIAAIGLWRMGRHLGGYGEHANDPNGPAVNLGTRGLIGLGLAGGVVPCWDAVVLVLLAEAVGRVTLGLALLTAFSLGLAAVLVAVGITAAHLRGFVERRDGGGIWVTRLGLLSASALTAIGLYLLLS